MNTLKCRRWLTRGTAVGFATALHRIAFLLAFLMLVSIFTAFTASSFSFAQNATPAMHPTENDVEAAYLYNFGKFVTWPHTVTPTGPQSNVLNICILGQDPFGPVLDQIVANGKIDDRPLAVLRLSNTSSVSDCSIIFISRSETSQLEKDLSTLAQFPVLTVSDMPGFAEKGGTIQFILQQNRVRFKVNLVAARKCGLALSSQLLKVAVDVVGDLPEGAPR